MSYENYELGAIEKTPQQADSTVRKPGSVDSEDGGDTYHDTLKGHTKNDRADMSRMGRVQELRVCDSVN